MLACPTVVVKMDATACGVVLETAVTNATRHRGPRGPQVRLAVEVLDGCVDGQSGCLAEHRLLGRGGRTRRAAGGGAVR